MSITIDDALKRIGAHAQVISCGIFTANGQLLTSSGTFDASDAARCARLCAVASSAIDDSDDDNSGQVELVRARSRGRELILTRSSNVVIAVVVEDVI